MDVTDAPPNGELIYVVLERRGHFREKMLSGFSFPPDFILCGITWKRNCCKRALESGRREKRGGQDPLRPGQRDSPSTGGVPGSDHGFRQRPLHEKVTRRIRLHQ